jgi:tetratricopeptide (TPR) repeat protein
VVALYASAAGVAEQLSRTSLREIHEPRSKFAMWRSTLALVEESPWVGVGRGGFESSFTRVHPASAFSTFSHTENEYLQAVVDWGIPAAVLLGIAVLALAVAALRRWRDGPLAAAALGAMAVVALQSNFDFGLELLGVAVPVTAITATVTWVPIREATGSGLVVVRWFRAAHVLALVAGAFLLTTSSTASIAEDHEALRADPDLSLTDLADPVERHPLDYYNYALAAQRMERDGSRRSITFLNHALTLHPTHPGLHVRAAQMLYAAGHVEQSTIEYAAALNASTRRRELIEEIVKRFPVQLAARAIPIDDLRTDEYFRVLVQDLKRADIATKWLMRSLEIRPDNLRVCERLFELAVHQADITIAETVSRRCPHFEPTQAARVHLARTLDERGHHAEAIRLLGDVASWRGHMNDKIGAWLVTCDAHASLEQWDDAKRCLSRLEASGMITPERMTEISSRLVKLKAWRDASTPVP